MFIPNNADTRYELVFSTLQINCSTLWTPTVCSITHFNYDINYLVQTLQDSPQFSCTSQYWGPRIPILLSDLTIISGIPYSALLQFKMKNWLYYKGYRGMDRGTSILGEFWKEPKHRSFCPHRVGYHHHPCSSMCCPTLKLSVPVFKGVFMEVSSLIKSW